MDQNQGQASEPAAGSNPAGGAASGIARNARGLAIAALIVAVLAPFGEDALLGTLNIRTPMARRLTETTLAVDRLERRAAELDRQVANATTLLAKLQGQFAGIDDRIEASHAAIRTLALVELGAALRRPGPFDLELAAVRASAAAPAEIAPLLARIDPYAATGIPGIAQLRRDFSDLRARVDWAERGYMPMAWMTRLISWPRGSAASPSAEPPRPDPAGKLLGEAARELGKENLPGALAAAQQVSGPDRETLTDWMEDAGARVAADELARRINDLVVQRLAGGRPASRP